MKVIILFIAATFLVTHLEAQETNKKETKKAVAKPSNKAVQKDDAGNAGNTGNTGNAGNKGNAGNTGNAGKTKQKDKVKPTHKKSRDKSAGKSKKTEDPDQGGEINRRRRNRDTSSVKQ